MVGKNNSKTGKAMNKIGFMQGMLVIVSLLGLVCVYLFQRLDVAAALGIKTEMWNFITNRSIRFLLNDLLGILLIYALFQERRFVWFALLVQVFGLIFILTPYFVIRFKHPELNGPLISFLHRLVLNPILVLLLIPAFYYQKISGNSANF